VISESSIQFPIGFVAFTMWLKASNIPDVYRTLIGNWKSEIGNLKELKTENRKLKTKVGNPRVSDFRLPEH
jgi:predicted transcriptional regulator